MNTITRLVLYYIQNIEEENIIPSWESFDRIIQPIEIMYLNPKIADELVNHLHIGFKDYLTAYRWIGEHVTQKHTLNHWTEDFQPDDYYKLFTNKWVLRRNYYELLDQSIVKLIYSRVYTSEEKTIMKQYTHTQLKKMVVCNHYLIENIINKNFKHFWTKAYIETKRWGFNMFALRSHLNDDVLCHIYSFCDNHEEHFILNG